MCYEFPLRPSHRSRQLNLANPWRLMWIFPNGTLILWLDALKSAQQNGAWAAVFTLIIFQLLCPSFTRSTNCFSRVLRLKPMDCFCSRVAVVILSLPWNSHLQGNRNLCSCLGLFGMVSGGGLHWACSQPNSSQSMSTNMWKQDISFRICCVRKQTAPWSSFQVVWGLWSISKSSWRQS